MRFLAIAILLPSTVPAQVRADASRTVDELARCRAVAGDAERLACFDRLAERIAAARRSGELLVLDRAKVVERKRARFGLSGAPGELFGGGPEDAATEVKQLETTLRAAAPAGAYGMWNLELANGMVWRTVESLEFPPRTGAPIKLRTATLGGYRASIGGGRSFLVKRLR